MTNRNADQQDNATPDNAVLDAAATNANVDVDTEAHDSIDRGRDQAVAENSTPNAQAVEALMNGDDTIKNASAEQGETRIGFEGGHQFETATIDRAATAKKPFVWNQENIRMLLSRELETDLGQVRAKPPYNIWVLKTTRQSALKFERAFIINKDGTLKEIPTGISIGTYYDEVKAGGVAVEYNGMNGDKPFRTVTFYGGKTLPDMEVSDEADEDF